MVQAKNMTAYANILGITAFKKMETLNQSCLPSHFIATYNLLQKWVLKAQILETKGAPHNTAIDETGTFSKQP